MSESGYNSHSLAAAMRQAKMQGQIHRFLSGETTEPRSTTLQPIAKFFDIPLDAMRDESAATKVAQERGLVGAARLPRGAAVPQKTNTAEQTALLAAVVAIISTHPDAAALKNAFEAVVSTLTISGEAKSAAVMAALQRFRALIDQRASAGS